MTSNNVCPWGWTQANHGMGRMILSTADGNHDQEWGHLFQPDKQPRHSHRYTVTQEPAIVNQTPGQQNGAVTVLPEGSTKKTTFQTQNDPLQIEGQTGESDLNLPLYYVTLCQETDDSGVIDALPLNSVMYFAGDTCPQRKDPDLAWKPYAKAQGRFIMPAFTIATPEVEHTEGTAWPVDALNGNLLRHDHDADAQSIRPKSDSTSSTFGRPVHPASEFWVNFRTSSVNSEISKNGFPFSTLMTCIKTGTTETGTQLPENMTYFRATATCGDRTALTQTGGYFLIPSITGSWANKHYGQALSDEYRKPLHTHPAVKYQYSKTQAYKEQQNKSGSAASSSTTWWDPYADVDVTPEPSGPNIPYILLMQCSRNPAPEK